MSLSIEHPTPIRVHGLGTVVVDHQVVMDSLPEADTKGEVIEDRHQVGGPVPTALALLQRFGLETVFQGKWADDPFGQMIEADLNAQGIQFDQSACRSSSRSGFAHVWVDRTTGRRSIAAYRGSHPVEPHEVQLRELADATALHLDGWSTTAAMAAAETVRSAGGTVFLDLGSPKPQLDDLLEHVNVMTCPERLIHRLFAIDDLAEGAQRLLAMGPREVTITRGERGAMYFNSEETIIHEGFAVNAVDTNGAGDVFSGATVYASLQSWPAARKLDFACAAAALKCRQLGNRAALPDLNAIEEFLATRER